MPKISDSHPLTQVRAIRFGRLSVAELDWTVHADAWTDWIYDQLYNPRTSDRALTALRAIEAAPKREGFYELVVLQLDSIWASVRIQALRMLQDWPLDGRRFNTGPNNLRFPTLDEYPLLEHIIRNDPSWTARQEALRTLTTATTGANDSILMHAREPAFTDPHWRVRHAVMEDFQTLLVDGRTNYGPWDHQLASMRASAEMSDAQQWRAQGFREYFCQVNEIAEPPPPIDDDLESRCRDPHEHWDYDPSVLAAYLDRCELGEPQQWPKFVSHYLNHADSRVTRAALRHLVYCDEQQLIGCLTVLDDPRCQAAELVEQYVVDEPTEIAAAEHLLDLGGQTIHPSLSPYDGPSVGQLRWALSRLTMLDNPHEVIRPWLPIATVRDWLPPRRKAMTPAVVELASVLGDLSENAEELEIDATDIREALLSLSASPSFAERNAALRAIARSPSWLTADQRDDLWHRNGKSTFTTEQTLAVAILMREYGSQWKHFDEAVDEWSRSESWQVRRQVAAEAYARQLHAPAESPPLVDQVLKTLQGDSNSLVRAAAITQPRAEELLANPEIETSWGVLEMAARVAKVNLEALEPDLPEAPAKRSTPSRFHCSPKEHGPCVSFPLDEPTMVSRIGISGHYGLPPKGYAKAAAEGVNLFFWEPGYSSMTAFCQGIAGHVREQLHFIGGTFKANSKGVRDDVHRMLKHLKLDRVSLFLLFWTRGWSRITDEVLATLDQLEASGDVARASISTHDRELACQAMRGDVELSRKRQWNPLMVRYSAAHRGAESEVFPLAIETGTTVVSFNNLCYGRLLLPLPGKTELPRIDAVDCYRFALSHPAVAVSLSAPATLAQLDENLAALHDPTLPEERRQRLLQHGASIYEQDRLFQRCVRSR